MDTCTFSLNVNFFSFKIMQMYNLSVQASIYIVLLNVDMKGHSQHIATVSNVYTLSIYFQHTYISSGLFI